MRSDRRAVRVTAIRQSIRVDDFGCWIWTGRLTEDGYAYMAGERAHRIAYQAIVGPIPHGLSIDHTCHDPRTCVCGPRCPHRRCVNPAHMEPVTGYENWLRGQLGQKYLAKSAA